MAFLPKLTEETQLEFRSTIYNLLIRTIESAYKHPFQNCISCDHFKEETEMCQIWNARPPARVICFGCEKYDNKDFIPF